MSSSSTQENYLRWDSLGEFLALAASFEHLADNPGQRRRESPRSDPRRRHRPSSSRTTAPPARKLGTIDNRGSHFYLALYWAQALAEQGSNFELKKIFEPLAQALAENEENIISELNAVQGNPTDIGGYYLPDVEKANAALRPSTTLNGILDTV